jgi:hypothetical protein
MDSNDKKKLFMVTIILDLLLLTIFFLNKLFLFDKIWVITVILSHILFYYSLHTQNKPFLEILHYLVFILPFLVLFANNIYLKVISLFLVILIQFLWIYEERCILNEKGETFGYGKEISYAIIILTVLLSLNIGYSYKSL